MNASTSGISLASSLANLCDMQPLTTSFCPGRFRNPRSWCASRMASIDSSLAESINAQVLIITTSASSAFAVTSIPCAKISPSIISASTRFLAQPRLIIPTFNADTGDKTSVADRGRLIESTLQSIDHDIVGAARDKLAVLSHFYGAFFRDVHPETLPLDNDWATVRSGLPLKHGLSPLLILRYLDVSPFQDPNLQLLFRKGRKTRLCRCLHRGRGFRRTHRKRLSDLNSIFNPSLHRERARRCRLFRVPFLRAIARDDYRILLGGRQLRRRLQRIGSRWGGNSRFSGFIRGCCHCASGGSHLIRISHPREVKRQIRKNWDTH